MVQQRPVLSMRRLSTRVVSALLSTGVLTCFTLRPSTRLGSPRVRATPAQWLMRPIGVFSLTHATLSGRSDARLIQSIDQI